MSTTAQPPSGGDPTSHGGAVGSGPVLAVYAHPDDETLQAGGVLALAASQGRRVVVVTATRGERGEMIGTPQLEGTDAVASVREQEIAAALGALGVHEHHWLDTLPSRGGSHPSGGGSHPSGGGSQDAREASSSPRWTDSGMTWLAPGVAGPGIDAPATALTSGDLATQARALARLLREVRPAVVLCDEPGGAYGHPDHVSTHEITVAAVELAEHADGDVLPGEPWRVPVLAWVVQDAERLRAARATIAAAAVELDARDVQGWPLLAPAGTVGTDGADGDVVPDLPSLAREAGGALTVVTIDVIGQLPRVLAALLAYPSQVQGATIPVLDRPGGPGLPGPLGRRPTAALARLTPRNAAVGWYALSNAELAPILPVVALELARGEAADLGLPTVQATAGDRVTEPVQGTGAGAGTGAGGVVGTRTLLLRGLGGLLVGLVSGIAGTLAHRVSLGPVPLGMALAVVLVIVGGLLARAAARGSGLLGFGVGVVAAVQLLAFSGGGGDVLVPGDTRGTAWLLLSVVAVGVAAFLPGRWVGETPRRGSR